MIIKNNPMAAIAAAMLDAQLFIKFGDTRCQHSVKMLVRDEEKHGEKQDKRTRKAVF